MRAMRRKEVGTGRGEASHAWMTFNFFHGKNTEEEEDRTVAVASGAALEYAEYAWMVRSLASHKKDRPSDGF
jgi:hypothetical protein